METLDQTNEINFTPRLQHAVNIATYAHRNQMRKGSELPYISHPFSVMYLASQVTNDEDVHIACLFHDIVEDVPEEYPVEQMREDFGDRVVGIVLDVTKDDKFPSWQDRANAYLKHLEFEASDEAVIVSTADKLHNLMSILMDYEEKGEDLWSRFNANKERQLWWYRSIVDVAEKRMPNMGLVKTLGSKVIELEKII